MLSFAFPLRRSLPPMLSSEQCLFLCSCSLFIISGRLFYIHLSSFRRWLLFILSFLYFLCFDRYTNESLRHQSQLYVFVFMVLLYSELPNPISSPSSFPYSFFVGGEISGSSSHKGNQGENREAGLHWENSIPCQVSRCHSVNSILLN